MSTVPSNVRHFLPALIFFFPFFHFGVEASNNDKVVSIGAIIDLSSRVGKEEKLAFELAVQNYNNKSGSLKLSLHCKDSGRVALRAISIGEKIYSNLTRMVIVVWLFLVMILTSSYTANLSSMLTVQQLQPAVTNAESLIRSNSKIGFSGDPFVRKYLENVLLFKSQNIIEIGDYNYTEEFKFKHIAAAFIEFPYEKVFMSKNCRGYSAFTPSNRYGGLGFMFQKGSPITRDFSKAILQLSESGDLKSLEDKWLSRPDECSANITTNANGSLKLQSFWVLFAACAFTSTFCVIISRVLSMTNNQQHQEASEGDHGFSHIVNVWKKVLSLANYIYYEDSIDEGKVTNSGDTKGVQAFSLELRQGSTSDTLAQDQALPPPESSSSP